ncbi:hypothetical protein PUN28_004766 [Cardiocondyla obscurior]|uniref:Uncharacterized protein n=1 Tax=Cardiocondyla obscurior TaxID=286306 RepID=A0AAW2GCH5_9HYME
MVRRTRSTDDPRRHRVQGERKSPSRPLYPSRSSFSPCYMRSFANACVMLFLYVDRVAVLCRSLSLTLSRAPSVTFYPPPLIPATHISSSTVSSSSSPPRPSLRCRTPRAPSSLYAYFIALLALHFHPRVLRLPSCRFLRLYRGRGSMSLPARRSGYS